MGGPRQARPWRVPFAAAPHDLGVEQSTLVKRTGYTLLPDYACTAHMVQGMALTSALADCGDALDNPALKDMLAAYVALSRVRQADGLLLPRAFSRFLFRQGPPPGPHCLMNLLRARCSSGARFTYTDADATREYAALLTTRVEAAKLRKQGCRSWQCFDCGIAYPPEGFGASAARTDEIFRVCVAPGRWLACTACTSAHELAARLSDLLALKLRCQKCGQIKPAVYFASEGGSAGCRHCELADSLLTQQCRKCHRTKPLSQFASGTTPATGSDHATKELPLCTACCPDLD